MIYKNRVILLFMKRENYRSTLSNKYLFEPIFNNHYIMRSFLFVERSFIYQFFNIHQSPHVLTSLWQCSENMVYD